MDYYEMLITCTGSTDGENDWRVFDDHTKIFDTVEDAQRWLKNQYACAKRLQMYSGNGIPCGYLYEFKNADWSHSPVEQWWQRDWVSFSKLHSEDAFEELKYEIPDA